MGSQSNSFGVNVGRYKPAPWNKKGEDFRENWKTVG
jgi:hypothetical protein